NGGELAAEGAMQQLFSGAKLLGNLTRRARCRKFRFLLARGRVILMRETVLEKRAVGIERGRIIRIDPRLHGCMRMRNIEMRPEIKQPVKRRRMLGEVIVAPPEGRDPARLLPAVEFFVKQRPLSHCALPPSAATARRFRPRR